MEVEGDLQGALREPTGIDEEGSGGEPARASPVTWWGEYGQSGGVKGREQKELGKIRVGDRAGRRRRGPGKDSGDLSRRQVQGE